MRRIKQIISLSFLLCLWSVSMLKAQQRGFACIYSLKLHGTRTATGERFDKNELTAAHRTLPLGTIVRVTNLKTQNSVIVRINDRGPFTKKYILDLSPAAAEAIDFGFREGRAEVLVEPVVQ